MFTNPVLHDMCRSHYYESMKDVVYQTLSRNPKFNDMPNHRIYLDICLDGHVPFTILQSKSIFSSTMSVKLSDIHYDSDIEKSIFKKLQNEIYQEHQLFLIDESGSDSRYKTEIFLTDNYAPEKILPHGLNDISNFHFEMNDLQSLNINEIDNFRPMTDDEIKLYRQLEQFLPKHDSDNNDSDNNDSDNSDNNDSDNNDSDNDSVPDLISESDSESESDEKDDDGMHFTRLAQMLKAQMKDDDYDNLSLQALDGDDLNELKQSNDIIDINTNSTSQEEIE